MILNTKLLQQACNNIKLGLSSINSVITTDIIEFSTKDNHLFLSVADSSFNLNIDLGLCSEDFHATIAAGKFLDLLARTSTDTIELKVNENYLAIKGHGKYKVPLVFEDNNLLVLPQIEFTKVDNSFNINGNILNEILINNSKELLKIPKKANVNQVQRMYYIDNNGAITFYTGACISEGHLAEQPFKLLLNSNLVKLFTLFKNASVKFEINNEHLADTIQQTKIRLSTDSITLTSILNIDDTLIKQIPAQAIRSRALSEYAFNINIDRETLLKAVQRLMSIYNGIDTNKLYGNLSFNGEECIISDLNNDNNETINYKSNGTTVENYTAILDLLDLKYALENSNNNNINIKFGNHIAFVLIKYNSDLTIYTVIPEVIQKSNLS